MAFREHSPGGIGEGDAEDASIGERKLQRQADDGGKRRRHAAVHHAFDAEQTWHRQAVRGGALVARERIAHLRHGVPAVAQFTDALEILDVFMELDRHAARLNLRSLIA